MVLPATQAGSQYLLARETLLRFACNEASPIFLHSQKDFPRNGPGATATAGAGPFLGCEATKNLRVLRVVILVNFPVRYIYLSFLFLRSGKALNAVAGDP